jgi:zinc protease
MTPPLDLRLPHRTFTLPNGLRVSVHADGTLPIVSVNLWYCVGSKDERPGRTGFAHLFEHLMFEGSAHAPPGSFDAWLEDAGGINNGSTSPDRTNYWITVPTGALELALFLEADRMGALSISQESLDAQRDVVMNERRQAYENQPYGLAHERQLELLYPEGHPYRWPVIGSMADIAAAELADVEAFFRTWYTPSNALLAIAGDVDGVDVEGLVASHFGAIPGTAGAAGTAGAPGGVGAGNGGGAGRRRPAPVRLDAPRRLVLEDTVSLPRLYLAWHSPPLLAAGDAALDVAATILGSGKSAWLYQRLVYELQLAQDVEVVQDGAQLGSLFHIVATARPDVPLGALEREIHAALGRLAAESVSGHVLERARHTIETAFVDTLRGVGGFGGRADRLNHYAFYAGTPDFLARDMARYAAVTAADVRAAAGRWLCAPAAAVAVVPHGRPELAGEGDT